MVPCAYGGSPGPSLGSDLLLPPIAAPVVDGLFCEREDADSYFVLIEGLVQHIGIPVALYTDRHAVFRHTPGAGLPGMLTQFRRAMGDSCVVGHLIFLICWRFSQSNRLLQFLQYLIVYDNQPVFVGPQRGQGGFGWLRGVSTFCDLSICLCARSAFDFRRLVGVSVKKSQVAHAKQNAKNACQIGKVGALSLPSSCHTSGGVRGSWLTPQMPKQ